MRKCPNCGQEFNFWRCAIGEFKEHRLSCDKQAEKKRDVAHLAGMCRGCPADCFRNFDHSGKEQADY